MEGYNRPWTEQEMLTYTANERAASERRTATADAEERMKKKVLATICGYEVTRENMREIYALLTAEKEKLEILANFKETGEDQKKYSDRLLQMRGNLEKLYNLINPRIHEGIGDEMYELKEGYLCLQPKK